MRSLLGKAVTSAVDVDADWKCSQHLNVLDAVFLLQQKGKYSSRLIWTRNWWIVGVQAQDQMAVDHSQGIKMQVAFLCVG